MLRCNAQCSCERSTDWKRNRRGRFVHGGQWHCYRRCGQRRALVRCGHDRGCGDEHGTVAPGNSPGILNIDGSFTQTATGTLAIELTPSAVAGTGYDQVSVTGLVGTAALDGTLALAPAAGLYTAGATYDIVSATGGITGGFATITGATLSPFLSFTATGIVTTATPAQVYRLTVTRTSYATGLGASGNPNRIAVANGFQTLVAGATGDTATLVINADNSTAAQAAVLFDQLSPEAYGAYATALQDQGELFTRQVALHLMQAQANEDGRARIWGSGYGQWGNGKNRSFLVGSDQDITGGTLGVDFGSGGLTFGVAAGLFAGEGRLPCGDIARQEQGLAGRRLC
ncbi:MAG: autotransporter outer membrane beta-barrel domain-containing protein [Sphingomonadales bacterium]|nr:autotransporter outer membrane beta-barrel domain-containing protein [Sphingomonadales bacterium]